MSFEGEGITAALELLRPLGDRVALRAPLGALTTYRVGGPAAVRVTVQSPGDLSVVADAARAGGLEVLMVGRGSNLLVADSGFPGIAVILDPVSFGCMDVAGTTVRAGAAAAMPALARRSVEAGLTGLEWAVGVPGSVGGGVRMNAGGHGSDMASVLARADVADLGAPAAPVRTWSLRDLGYGYRTSALGREHAVVAASLELLEGDPVECRRTIREIVRWRREHQPGGQNAGSVFANPPGDSAGRLIDAAGLKGTRRGSATVSEKHANFFQADPDGSADDVYALVQVVKAEVLDRLGADLRPEVQLVGFDVSPSTEGSDFSAPGS